MVDFLGSEGSEVQEGLICSSPEMRSGLRSIERQCSPMEQQPFSEVTFQLYRKPTRRERFLDEANRVVPWVSRLLCVGSSLNPEILP